MMAEIEKVYDTGLLYHHYANTAYPLTPHSFQEYKLRDEKAIANLLAAEWKGIEEYSLYVHIPFCERRCRFCEYTVLENASTEVEAEYVELLLKELDMYAPLVGGKKMLGFDIGGGTPLKLSLEELQRIVGKIEERYAIVDGVIRSIETTPVIAAREPEKLSGVRALGFQRISMGIQTVSPHLLEELGRAGEPHIYEKAVRNIRKAGFEQFNIDLMYGFLNQNDKDLETTLLYAIRLKPTQITLYRNRYKGTKLEGEAGGVSLYKAMRQYRLAYQILTDNGYHANVGKNTFSRIEGDWGTSDYLTHRVIEGMPYLGVGLGAQSFGLNYLAYNEGAASKKLESYREKLERGVFPLQDIYELPLEESAAKMVAVSFYFGFIDTKAFLKRFGVPFESMFKEEVDFVLAKKLMEYRENRLILTRRGADFINGVIPLFYSRRSKEELFQLYENRRQPDSEGERQFLATYNIEKYPRPSVTTDVVGLTLRTELRENYRSPSKYHLAILLIRRGDHPFMNRWALPGGFLRPNETVEHCAQRELFEETGLNADIIYPIGCFSATGRDPRGWIISNAFLSIVNKNDMQLMSGDDALDAKWFDLTFVMKGDHLSFSFQCEDILLKSTCRLRASAYGLFDVEVLSSDLAFDHAVIIAKALLCLQGKMGTNHLAFAFLPTEFSLAELQSVHELIMGHPLQTPNFRRKMMPLLTETTRRTEGDGHRPAILYTMNHEG